MLEAIQDKTIAFIGGGNMARCIISGLLKQGISPAQIVVSNPGEEKRQQLAQAFGITTTTDNIQATQQADIVILAVKPQILHQVAIALAPVLKPDSLVISLAAGVTTVALQNWLGRQTAIVRAMPNTPSQIQLGATGLFATTAVSELQKQWTTPLFNAIGISRWVEQEHLIDAVIAVAGSAPAYYFLILDAICSKGEMLGLSAEDSKAMAIQTMLGAATLAQHASETPAQLRQQVTSKGGTTEQAILRLQQGGLDQLIHDAMDAAVARAAEMSAAFSQDN